VPADQRIFESLALELFALQFEHNLAYRRICDARRASPQNYRTLDPIPLCRRQPLKNWIFRACRFKSALSAFIRVEHAAATKRHFHNAGSLAIYEASLLGLVMAQVAASEFPLLLWRRGPGREAVCYPNLLRVLAITHHQPPPHVEPLAIGDWQLLSDSLSRSCSALFVVPCLKPSARTRSRESAFLAVSSDGGWTLDLERTMVVLNNLRKTNNRSSPWGGAPAFPSYTSSILSPHKAFVFNCHPRFPCRGDWRVQGRSREAPKRELHASSLTPGHRAGADHFRYA